MQARDRQAPAQGIALHALLCRLRSENGPAKTMNDPSARSYHWLFWCLAVAGFCLDQASKYEVFRRLYPVAERDQYGQLAGEAELVPGVFRFRAGFTETPETSTGI